MPSQLLVDDLPFAVVQVKVNIQDLGANGALGGCAYDSATDQLLWGVTASPGTLAFQPHDLNGPPVESAFGPYAATAGYRPLKDFSGFNDYIISSGVASGTYSIAADGSGALVALGSSLISNFQGYWTVPSDPNGPNIHYSPNGENLLISNDFWQTASTQLVNFFGGSLSSMGSYQPPSGNYVAAIFDDVAAYFETGDPQDPADWEITVTPAILASPCPTAGNPSGSRIVIGSRNGLVYIWDRPGPIVAVAAADSCFALGSLSDYIIAIGYSVAKSGFIIVSQTGVFGFLADGTSVINSLPIAPCAITFGNYDQNIRFNWLDELPNGDFIVGGHNATGQVESQSITRIVAL